MEREIKFKAWYRNHFYSHVEHITYPDGSWHVNGLGNNQSGLFSPSEPPILLQYTGLKDKNGKEIYEGDIYTASGGKYQVMFINGAFCGGKDKTLAAALGWKGSGDTDDDDVYECDLVNTITVIGNIYENPELLK